MNRKKYIVYLIGIFQLIVSIVLGIQLFDLLPTKFLIVYAVVEVVFALLTFLAARKKWSSVVMGILSVIVSAVMILGIFALHKINNTVEDVTKNPEEVTIEMAIVVLKESEAEEVSDISEYLIGYVSEEVTVGAKKVMEEINAEIGGSAGYQEFFTAADLVDELYAQTVNAIIIDKAYLDILAEIEGYETLYDRVKIIYSYEVVDYIHLVKEETEKTEDEGDNQDVEQTTPGIQTDAKHFVVYISGIDTYGSVTARRNSDVNILVVVNTETKHVQLINTPRDYYIPLPNSNGVKDKLTHAGIYGVDCSMGTLEMLYGIPIDYYVRMNFSGFEEIVNALGGVDVYSQYEFTVGSKHFNQGMNYLNGSDALIFARTRKAFAAGDNQRGKNQMAVVTAVIQKMASPELLRNYTEILSAIGGAFQTNFTSEEIYNLVKGELDNPGAWTIETYAVTGKGENSTTFSMPNRSTYVMVPYQDNVQTAREKIIAVLEEE